MSTALTVPRLHRSPLLLRPFAAADAALVAEAGADPVIPPITTVPTGSQPAAVQAFIDRQHDRARRGRGTRLRSPMQAPTAPSGRSDCGL